MLTQADKEQMEADNQNIIADDSTEIIIRRGQNTLLPQTVRLVRAGGQGREAASGVATSQAEGRIKVLGNVNLDIQPQDRFNDGGSTLYQVTFIDPNKSTGVVAEAKAVQ